MEYKSCGKWYALVAIVLIAAVTILSGIWLRQMTDVLKSPPGKIEVRHVYANFESETKDDKGEETQYTLYKQAEESLREQMNTWLTIVGFFGVLFGLIVPLAGYLLQRHSLSEERERIMEDVQKTAKVEAEKATVAIKKETQKQIDDIRVELRKVDGIFDKIEETRGMIDADRKIIEQVRQTTQQTTERLEEVKGETVKTSQEVRLLSEVVAKGNGKKDASESEFEKIKQKAEQGDVEAQNHFGWMYRYGEGVKKDEFESVYWYRKAANQGYAAAQCNLGLAYRFGRGVDNNDTKAVYWYQKAAEQGVALAENNLGFMLANGLGCEKDEERALEWYHRAAEHGNAMGRKNLGEIYENGSLGVKVDLTKAKDFYRQVLDDPNASDEVKKLAQEGLARIAKLQGGK